MSPVSLTNKNKTIHSTIDVGEITAYEMLHIELQEGSGTIGVEKSASHQLSHNEIASDNPCSQRLSGNTLVSD
jgi:hypothetical protein